MVEQFCGTPSITLITEARDASPYVTLKPASLAACSTDARKSMATLSQSAADCSYRECSAAIRRVHLDARGLHVKPNVLHWTALG